MQVAVANYEPPANDSMKKAVLNVLVLDDVETDRMRIRRFLRKAGLDFNYIEASDLEEFRDALDRTNMDLVFLDYMLDMDTGLDALKLLSGHEDQTEALPIMVTSVDRCDIAVEAMRNGCADYLVKEQLTVESMRKSIISAFERRILIASLSEAQSSRQAVRTEVARFARTSGPEMKSILAATLRNVRASRRGVDAGSPFAVTLNRLEGNCQDIFGFFDDLSQLLDDLEVSNTNRKRISSPD